MKIAWATPFSESSAIGQISRIVTDLLARRGHDVLIIRTELDPNAAIPIRSELPVISWQEVDRNSFARGQDVALVNFGDHYGFHAGALELIGYAPCIGIFHDFYLYNLFSGWLATNGYGRERHDQEISNTYGQLPPIVAHVENDLAAIQEIAERAPMTEWVAAKCASALAHSKFYLSRLERACPGPLDVAPIPSRDPPVRDYVPQRDKLFTLTTVGILNPNKCADAVIQAIVGSSYLSERAEYRLVGAISEAERQRLTSLAADAGFQRLSIIGTVDDQTLFSEMERADAICCLRRPVLEGCSASAIEGMKAGRPVVVANAGFYADLPDELVFKVASVEPEPLRAILEELASRPELRQSTGSRARAWALEHFSDEQYVCTVENLIARSLRVKPLHQLSGRIAREFAALGLSADDALVDRIASEMSALFKRTLVNNELES